MNQFSIYRNVWDKNSQRTIELSDALELIRSNQDLANYIGYLRQQRDNPDEFRKLKMRLPAVTINGTFESRNSGQMLSYSPYTAIDLDHFESWTDVMNYKNFLIKNVTNNYPFIVSIFVSPSGLGLKVICQHDNRNPDLHYNMYKQLERIFGIPQVDTGVFDISRLTFLSYDPDLYINQNPIPFHFIYDVGISTPMKKAVVGGGCCSYKFEHTLYEKMINSNFQNQYTDKQILTFLNDNVYRRFREDYLPGHNRQLHLLSRAKELCEYGVLYDNALPKLMYWFHDVAGLPESTVRERVSYAYATNTFGCRRDEITEMKNNAIKRKLNNYGLQNYNKRQN